MDYIRSFDIEMKMKMKKRWWLSSLCGKKCIASREARA
ncbi:hypothetical protein B4119_0344 [Parageobacillus caldoxylosilyticus]|uniref:Uncharacterized protein n=1 Tax=Saccharococcus caldoxylosilyticus TaxID=81408 RepID=A0A150M0I0_9BACL|nr:hypothetical protein B4119_0344 [Parageobacillus caldoxylosilyticus]